jgi:hypothetical protein
MKFSTAIQSTIFSDRRCRITRASDTTHSFNDLFDPLVAKQAIASIFASPTILTLPTRDPHSTADDPSFLASVGDDIDTCNPVHVKEADLGKAFVAMTTRSAAIAMGWPSATNDPTLKLIPTDDTTGPGYDAIHCWLAQTDDEQPVLVAVKLIQPVALGEDCEIPDFDFDFPPPNHFNATQHVAYMIGFLNHHFEGKSIHACKGFCNAATVATAGLPAFEWVEDINVDVTLVLGTSPSNIKIQQQFELERSLLGSTSVPAVPTVAPAAPVYPAPNQAPSSDINMALVQMLQVSMNQSAANAASKAPTETVTATEKAQREEALKVAARYEIFFAHVEEQLNVDTGVSELVVVPGKLRDGWKEFLFSSNANAGQEMYATAITESSEFLLTKPGFAVLDHQQNINEHHTSRVYASVFKKFRFRKNSCPTPT